MNLFQILTPVAAASALLLVACGTPDRAVLGPQAANDVSLAVSPVPPGNYSEVPTRTLTSFLGVTVYNGGFGSAVAYSPLRPGVFFLLTDRGPNIDFRGGKMFLAPDFTPQIGVFEAQGSNLHYVRTVYLRRADGSKITGLPNPVGQGGTGEVAYDTLGNVLGTDPDGVDSEGLVVMRDGTFWISDEYGPHMAHYDGKGMPLERVNPFSSPHALPAVLAKRRVNRGMEGLANWNSGKVLWGMMQSPLDNPSSAGRNSRALRIVRYDTQTGATAQFVYELDNTVNAVSEITAIGPSSFLVLERDGNFPGDPVAPATAKKVYKIDVEPGSTDVSDPANGKTGRLWGGKTLEELTDADRALNGIVPVRKVLLQDLLPLGYTHDKAEGIVFLDDYTFGVSNDDDFGIINASDGVPRAKVLPLLGVVDFGQLMVVRLPNKLRSY